MEWLTTNIAHSTEFLLPCWSWFRRMNATDDCGIVLPSNQSFHRITDHQAPSWIRQMVDDAMRCKVIELPQRFRRADQTPLGPHAIQHIPNLIKIRPRFGMYRYLDEPSDAWALRRRLVSDEEITKVKGPGKPLRIGGLNRPTQRSVTNMMEILDALQEQYPYNSTAEMVYFNESYSLKEQAKWFATKDVILAPHGAGLANAVFITKGTIVMQMYPPLFFFQSLDPLIEQAGGIALDWYNGTNPLMDWYHSKEHSWQSHNANRHANMTPDVQEVVDKILAALDVTVWNRLRLDRWKSVPEEKKLKIYPQRRKRRSEDGNEKKTKKQGE